MKMSHYDYEAMIFTEEPLQPEAQADLQAHVEACAECHSLAAAWLGMQRDLHAAPVEAPAPGFTARWQERLELDRQQAHRRQVAWTLGLSLAGALFMTLALLFFLTPVFETPKVYLYAFLYQALNVVIAADMVQNLLLGVVRSAASPLTVAIGLILVGIVSQLGVIWLASIRLTTKTRRV
jgi:anti-sigma factor RsiW